MSGLLAGLLAVGVAVVIALGLIFAMEAFLSRRHIWAAENASKITSPQQKVPRPIGHMGKASDLNIDIQEEAVAEINVAISACGGARMPGSLSPPLSFWPSPVSTPNPVYTNVPSDFALGGDIAVASQQSAPPQPQPVAHLAQEVDGAPMCAPAAAGQTRFIQKPKRRRRTGSTSSSTTTAIGSADTCAHAVDPKDASLEGGGVDGWPRGTATRGREGERQYCQKPRRRRTSGEAAAAETPTAAAAAPHNSSSEARVCESSEAPGCNMLQAV